MLGLLLSEDEYLNLVLALANGVENELVNPAQLEKAKLDLSKLVIKWVAVKNTTTGKIFYRKYWVDPAIKDDTEALKKKAIKPQNAHEEEFVEHFDHAYDHDHGDQVEVEKDGVVVPGTVTDFAMHHSSKGKGQMKYVKVTDAAGHTTTHKQEQVKLVKKAHHATLETTPTPSAPAKTAKNTPPDPLAGEEKFLQKLGGSTGAVLVEINGQKFVKKKGNDAGHIRAEYEANQLYKAFGVAVPEAHFKDDTLYLKYLEDSEDLLEALAFDNDGSLSKQIKAGFAVDALLGNWDVAGLNYDNILVKDNVGYRIDTGGSLLYRAQGGLKSSLGKDMATDVNDYITLLDSGLNPTSANVFGGVSRPDILAELDKLDLSKMPASVSAETKELIKKRYALMQSTLEKTYGGPKLVAKNKGVADTYSGQFYDLDWTKDANIHHIYGIVEQTIKFNEADQTMLAGDGQYGDETQALKSIKQLKGSSGSGMQVVNQYHDEYGLTYREIYAIMDYTGSCYSDMNGALAQKVNSAVGNINFENFHSDQHLLKGVKEFNPAAAPEFSAAAASSQFAYDLTAAAKTINHHHAQGNPQSHNKEKVAVAEKALTTLTDMLTEAGKARASAYAPGQVAMMQHYQQLAQQVVTAAQDGTKAPVVAAFDPSPYMADQLAAHVQEQAAKKAAHLAAPADGQVKAGPDTVKIKTKLEEYDSQSTARYLAKAKLMASGLRKLEICAPQTQAVVYRGLKFHHNAKAHATFDSEHAPGAVVAWQRFTSCGKNSSLGFYSNASVRIDIKNFKGTYVENLTQCGGENEVIGKPFSVFKVVQQNKNLKSTYGGAMTHYVVEHVM